MAVNRNPTVRQRRMGRMLRDLRVEVGLTLAQAAQALMCAESKMSRIEAANSGVRALDLRILLDTYGVTDEGTRARLQELAKHGRERGWWSQYESALRPAYADYIALEWDASDIYVVETALIPGLLQTPAYTDAVVRLQNPSRTDDEVAAQVKVREQRRLVFARNAPLRLWAILTESALHHPIGSPTTMRDQLTALASHAQESNIQLQILPAESPINVALHGPFGILTFPEAAETDVVYADNLLSTIYYEEPEQVDFYTTLYRRLNSEALSTDESLTRVHKAAKELE